MTLCKPGSAIWAHTTIKIRWCQDGINQVMPIWHIRCKRPSGAKLARLYEISKNGCISFLSCTSLIWLLNCAPSVGYRMILYLTSELGAESWHFSTFSPIPGIKWNWSKPSSFCLWVSFLAQGHTFSRNFERGLKILANSREKNSINYLTSLWGTQKNC